MSVTHRPIPLLPLSPIPKPVAKDLHRSYSTGHAEVSRAYCSSPFEITITSNEPFPEGLRANLVSAINAPADNAWTTVPFTRRDEKTLVCQIIPQKTGLFSFWTEFSEDHGSTWVDDRVPDAWLLVDPPQADHLRMYTLIPNVSGTFSDWPAEFQRIKDLGFNAIHLLPLTTLDASLSPYSAKSLFDADPSYADPTSSLSPLAQLEALVQAAKNLGLQLCFDLVLNHVGVGSDIVKHAPDWIVPDTDSPDGLRRARYLSEHGWQPWNDLVLINYEHPSKRIRAEVWDYMQEYALFWGKFASDTGGFVRFDNLHSSNKDFIDAVTLTLRDHYPTLGIIAEYFTDAATMLDTVPKWGLTLVLATPWDSRWVKQLREYLTYLHSAACHVRYFMPITSHDSGTPAQEFGSELSTIPRYVAAALLGTGATGITQGVEWGQKEKINFIGKQPRLVPNPQPKFGDAIRKINEILSAEPAFRRGSNFQFVDHGHDAVIAVFRKDDRPTHTGFLVLCNFDILGTQQLTIDLTPLTGATGPIKYIDLLTNEEQSSPSPQVTIKLPPGTAKVLRL